MSIEQSLERIATALEVIVGKHVGDVPTPAPAKEKKQKAEKPAPAATSPDDIIPGQDDGPAAPAAPVVPEEPTVMMCLEVKDSTQLRAFTQKALDAAEKESKTSNRPQLVNELVTFIKGEVCAKFSPTEPKLIKIPAEHAGKAAQMIFDWCMKNKILIVK